jgi:hypothetical protein
MDTWTYKPKGAEEAITYNRCDPANPDSGSSWCYLKGGTSASTCNKAKATTGGVQNNQHFYRYCTAPTSEVKAMKTKGAENACSMLGLNGSNCTAQAKQKACDMFGIDNTDCIDVMLKLATMQRTFNWNQVKNKVNAGFDIMQTCAPCFENPELSQCKRKNLDLSRLSQPFGQAVSKMVGAGPNSCAQLGSFFVNNTSVETLGLLQEKAQKALTS